MACATNLCKTVQIQGTDLDGVDHGKDLGGIISFSKIETKCQKKDQMDVNFGQKPLIMGNKILFEESTLTHWP